MATLIRLLAAVVLGLLSSGLPWQEFVYPRQDALTEFEAMPDSITRMLVGTAVYRLSEMGGEDILLCEAMRIEAPVGGWLVDGLALLELDGSEYRTFRIGVDDSGDVFTLIARGETEADSVVWYPSVGPDVDISAYAVAPEGWLEFEFLLNREDFESLGERYPRP